MHIRYALPFTIVPSLGLVLFSFIISAKVKKDPSLSQLDVGFFLFCALCQERILSASDNY